MSLEKAYTQKANFQIAPWFCSSLIFNLKIEILKHFWSHYGIAWLLFSQKMFKIHEILKEIVVRNEITENHDT